jgi:hypothetical protein
MAKQTAAMVLPDTYFAYSPSNIDPLLDVLPSGELYLYTGYKILDVKIEYKWLWFILEVLRKTRGSRSFKKEVIGLRRWDISLVMLYSRALNDEELVNALIYAKQLLRQYGIDANKSGYCRQIFVSVVYILCSLHPRMVNNIERLNSLPNYDDIQEGMTLTQWL